MISLFRRAFASRVFPPEIMEQLGCKHVKVIIITMIMMIIVTMMMTMCRVSSCLAPLAQARP